MIRRMVVSAYGDVDVLTLREGAPAPLGPGTLRIQVVAAGVNFADLLMRMGLYPGAPPRPFTPGYEVAGTVVERSPEAEAERPDLAPGARVMAVTRFGGYADEVVVPARTVFPLPAGWSFEEGAGFPVVFLTAWMALAGMARVRAGDRVLVHSVAGGVGLAALQIARAAGASVLGTASGEEKGRRARERGVARVVDPRHESLGTAVRDWAPGGVDVILEPRGWRGVRESLELLAPGGRIVAYGVNEMAPGRKRNLVHAVGSLLYLPSLNVLALLARNAGLYGLNLLTLWNRADLLEKGMSDLLQGVAEGRYRPEVGAVFPLEQAPLAHRLLHDRKNVGKVVLTTGLGARAAGSRETERAEAGGPPDAGAGTSGPLPTPGTESPRVETPEPSAPTPVSFGQLEFQGMESTHMTERVVVIGAGTMGHGIAQIAAQAGLDTVLVDVHPEALERGLAAVRKNLDQGVEKGKVTAEERDAALARLGSALDVEMAVRNAGVVIEAVPEDLALKKSLFTKLDRHAPETALLATNTSSLPVGEIAAAVRHPERVVGMHFFNPVHLMSLVEIVRGKATSDLALLRAKELGIRLGKECIVVNDTPGFATSRLGVVLGLEAMRMLEEGVASAEDIDKAMTLGYRHPVGPLRLSDLVGLDIRLAIAQHLHQSLAREAFRPPQILSNLVAEGKLGKKTGIGFYHWAEP